MFCLQISTAASSGGEKRSLWVDAGIHAREWISISTALYFIHQVIFIAVSFYERRSRKPQVFLQIRILFQTKLVSVGARN